MTNEQPIIEAVDPLGSPPWKTHDPFLFCVHHHDLYPKGNAQMGPDASLQGRRIGMDFEGKDGWSMYHGDVVPGFPRHPHRGFETVTLARQGFIDHSDSTGATARFGQGDVQWMTAGKGVVHSEMFPLVNRDAPNPTELFQIWLNLPRSSKMVEPHFAMLWSSTIPKLEFTQGEGTTRLTLVAGSLEGATPPTPPPDSWASRPENAVAIWTLQMEPGASWTIPAAEPRLHRSLYFFMGSELTVGDRSMGHHARIDLRSDAAAPVTNTGSEPCELLMLQGRPINEPIAQHGPFVMNAPIEIRQTILDYQLTGFGGWHWPTDGPVHSPEAKRFAIHSDGRREQAADA
ncbi:MAG: pirin family protein [Myxococcota bacterium]